MQAMFWFIIILVFLNTCVLATEHYRQPEWLDHFQVLYCTYTYIYTYSIPYMYYIVYCTLYSIVYCTLKLKYAVCIFEMCPYL